MIFCIHCRPSVCVFVCLIVHHLCGFCPILIKSTNPYFKILDLTLVADSSVIIWSQKLSFTLSWGTFWTTSKRPFVVCCLLSKLSIQNPWNKKNNSIFLTKPCCNIFLLSLICLDFFVYFIEQEKIQFNQFGNNGHDQWG